MRILSIGSDEHVFEEGSVARMRQEAYAKELGHVDLVVLSKSPHAAQEREPLSLFAAYASSRFARLFRAHDLASGLQKPDVVTAQDPFEIGLVGWLIAKRFDAPLHVQVHTDFLAPAYARHSLVNRIRVLIAGFVLKRAARIRVVSKRIKNGIESAYHLDAPISVLPIFVDVEKFRNARTPTELASRFANFQTKLLVVSRLEPEKNVELAIRAFAEAASENAHLIVVGQGSARERLKALARSLHISDHVFFEGSQDPASYYALADLVLVPSKYEGYGLVIVEALAAGKPVLSTDVGAARESGAIISSETNFAKNLKYWFENGARSGELKNYPYLHFEEYIRAYCDDIRACTSNKLSL